MDLYVYLLGVPYSSVDSNTTYQFFVIDFVNFRSYRAELRCCGAVNTM